MTLDKFFTLEEVAKSLQVTARTLKRMVKEKKITALNVSAGTGKRPTYRFLEADIKRFIAEEYVNFEDNNK
jgi:excisionase family DNA binding protein